jgi:hypothetical protein
MIYLSIEKESVNLEYYICQNCSSKMKDLTYKRSFKLKQKDAKEQNKSIKCADKGNTQTNTKKCDTVIVVEIALSS